MVARQGRDTIYSEGQGRSIFCIELVAGQPGRKGVIKGSMECVYTSISVNSWEEINTVSINTLV